MQTSDLQGAAVYTNGSSAPSNGPELSKMREVAFEKNPSEPMVTRVRTSQHKQQYSQHKQPHSGLFLTVGSVQGD